MANKNEDLETPFLRGETPQEEDQQVENGVALVTCTTASCGPFLFGLIGGIVLQFGWYHGMLLALETMSTLFTAQVAVIAVLVLLLIKCGALNYAVVKVVGDASREVDTANEPVVDKVQKHLPTAATKSPSDCRNRMLEGLSGFVLGMFAAALTLQLMTSPAADNDSGSSN